MRLEGQVAYKQNSEGQGSDCITRYRGYLVCYKIGCENVDWIHLTQNSV